MYERLGGMMHKIKGLFTQTRDTYMYRRYRDTDRNYKVQVSIQIFADCEEEEDLLCLGHDRGHLGEHC